MTFAPCTHPLRRPAGASPVFAEGLAEGAAENAPQRKRPRPSRCAAAALASLGTAAVLAAGEAAPGASLRAGAAPPAALPAAINVAQAAPPAAGADPMAQLRQRLAERLAGPRTGASDELRVVVRPTAPSDSADEPEARVRAPAPAGPTTTAVTAAATATTTAAAPVRPPASALLRQADVVLTTAHRPSANVTRPPREARRPAAAPAANPAGASAGTEGHGLWGYLGPAGPQAWGALRPEFQLCAQGERQSPIDIRGGLAVDLEPVRFEYQPSPFSVIDNGHTVQATLAPGNAIVVAGRRFELKQLHFHRPSEERIDGRQFEMSVHLVHQDEQGRLAVVAVLLDKGPPQPAVQLVWNNLPLEKHEEVPARVPLDLNQLLPPDARYYTYMGSMTTPPCSEGVQWVVMRQPVTASAEQIELFSRIYPMNARPVQQASGRRILQSQ